MEFSCKENLSFLPHLFIGSLTCINIDSCIFILWVIIQFYFIYLLLNLFHLWPSGTLSSRLLCPFNIPPSLFFSNTSLLSITVRYSRFILYFPCLNPRNCHLSKDPLFLLFREWYLETKVCAPDVLVGTGTSLFLGPLSGQS